MPLTTESIDRQPTVTTQQFRHPGSMHLPFAPICDRVYIRLTIRGDLVYSVTVSNETTQYDTRTEAVVAAREVSSETGRRVEVEDSEQREFLTYLGGSLESYIYETRRRHRKST
jgi:hypothetical protein